MQALQYLLVRMKPALEQDLFHAAMSEHGKLVLAQPSLRSLLRKLTISHKLRDPLPEERQLAEIDAVVELWFSHPEDIARFFKDPLYERFIREHEAAIQEPNGVRALVARMHMVF